jgi:aspartate/methionine/tyrosine aminotransferase
VFPTATEAAVFLNLNVNYFSCVPAYNQWGAVEAIRSPLTGPAVAEMVAAFQERRDLVVRELNRIPGISCPMPGGAFYVFPNVGGACERLGAMEAFRALPRESRERTSPATLLQRFLLFRWHVATMDRRSFGKIGSEGRHFLRISVATGIDDLREAVARIAAATDDADGFARFMAEEERIY